MVRVCRGPASSVKAQGAGAEGRRSSGAALPPQHLYPAGQAAGQAAAPGKVPTRAHVLQAAAEGAPGLGCHFPAGQSVQPAREAVPRTAAYVPAGQGTAAAAPRASTTLPCGESTQALAPEAPVSDPGLHSMQAPAPGASEKEPRAQGWQVAPREKKPAAHDEQAGCTPSQPAAQGGACERASLMARRARRDSIPTTQGAITQSRPESAVNLGSGVQKPCCCTKAVTCCDRDV